MIKEFEQPEWRRFLEFIGVDSFNIDLDRYEPNKFEVILAPYNARHIRWKAKIEFDSEIDYLAFKLKYGL